MSPRPAEPALRERWSVEKNAGDARVSRVPGRERSQLFSDVAESAL